MATKVESGKAQPSTDAFARDWSGIKWNASPNAHDKEVDFMDGTERIQIRS